MTAPTRKTSTHKKSKKKSSSKSSHSKKSRPISDLKAKLPDKEKKKEKFKTISRNLLRLYNFIEFDHPIEQEDILKELDMNTPNEKLRNKIEELKIELEAVYEENQALRQNALQSQIEYEDQISSHKIMIEDLKAQSEQVDLEIQDKMEKLTEKYEKRITKLEHDLEESVLQNQKITKVNEAVQMLQQKAKSLFTDNDRLEKENRNLTSKIQDNEDSLAKLENQLIDITKKRDELEKKIELQAMVIDGYKRKEK